MIDRPICTTSTTNIPHDMFLCQICAQNDSQRPTLENLFIVGWSTNPWPRFLFMPLSWDVNREHLQSPLFSDEIRPLSLKMTENRCMYLRFSTGYRVCYLDCDFSKLYSLQLLTKYKYHSHHYNVSLFDGSIFRVNCISYLSLSWSVR